MADISTDIKPAQQLPYAFARRHGVLISAISPDLAEITHSPLPDPLILVELRRHIACPLEFKPVPQDEYERLLTIYFEAGNNQAMQVMEDMGDDLDLDHLAIELSKPTDLLDSDDDAPIIRLINALFTEAVKDNASDIHIEPYESRLVVRFRIDGVLQEILQPPHQLAPLLASRIKVMAKLDIAEKRIPQDGRISIRVAGRPVDVRVSTLPSNHGERVVLRLLDNQAGRLDLSDLGTEDKILDSIDTLIHKPHGILLVTGPTGSGKTTTLYAALTRLNDHSRNIVTIEDPIEYYLDGVGQTQVNSKVEMTFARGLRAILRQDPDIVMIGEIRDLETAQIAIQASLTGHLVLSTLHTNNAVSTVTRLRDMGIEPFLLSSSLLGVLAQRLVRVLCPSCKSPYTATAKDCEVLGVSLSAAPTIYKAVGCDKCRQLGYSGRTGIYELLEVDEEVRAMIHDESNEQDITHYSHQQNHNIREDGLRKVLEGITTLDEIIRVTLDN
ncbi:General secretion pathway protein E [hydrothermal vent metagenome]|uniref:protein-secreting ATPase n=1 Tax=hydrothermal vent metagenome TaxID=652676 RepID=A0A3B0YCV1_9ZZZZ